MAYNKDYPAANLAIADIPEAIRNVIYQVVNEQIVDAGLLGGYLASQYPRYSDLLNLSVNPPFVVSGTYTVPTGCTSVYLSGCAGGGGGSSQFGCGGGAGESCYRRIITGLTPGQIIQVTIGVGGSPGTGPVSSIANSNSYWGQDGGSTSFGNYLTLTGGKGAQVTSTAYWPGDAGGTDAQAGSLPTCFFVYNNNFDRQGGKGGDCRWGQGGIGGYADFATNGGSARMTKNGSNGTGNGSGGGGGGDSFYNGGYNYYATSGGYGASGILIVEPA